MGEDDSERWRGDRRTVLRLATVAGATALAGCASGGPSTGGGETTTTAGGATATTGDGTAGGDGQSGPVSGTVSAADCGGGNVVTVADQQYRTTGTGVLVRGTVTNESGTNLTSIRVVVVLRDGSGATVASGNATKNGFTGGADWTFRVPFPGVDTSHVASYAVRVSCSGA